MSSKGSPLHTTRFARRPGAILLLVEALVLPGFGVAGVLGALAVLGSIVMSLVGQMPTMGDFVVALQILGTSILWFEGEARVTRLAGNYTSVREFREAQAAQRTHSDGSFSKVVANRFSTRCLSWDRERLCAAASRGPVAWIKGPAMRSPRSCCRVCQA